MAPQVICVVGPTASGKTALGVWLAQQYNGEVVSFDSMQVYRGMDIGTAKPTQAEMQGIPHHMIDVVDPEEDFSVQAYCTMAAPIVEDILSRGKRPILVGGTGLYLDALLRGHSFAQRSTGWRTILLRRLEAQGMGPLWKELERVDPEAAARLSPKDTKRVIRALEVWHETGKTITQHNLETKAIPQRFTALKLGLNFEHREDLWARIDRRVDQMAEQGLAEEVGRLLARGISPGCTAMQAIGYKELARAVLEGEALAPALEEVKLRSRQYAKRQLTWFRRDQETKWFTHPRPVSMEVLRRFATEKVTEAGIQ